MTADLGQPDGRLNGRRGAARPRSVNCELPAQRARRSLRRLAAVELAQRAVLDLPAFARPRQLPAVCDHAMNADPLPLPWLGTSTGSPWVCGTRIRRGDDDRAVAVDGDVGQPGERASPARSPPGARRPAPAWRWCRGRAGSKSLTAVEDAVLDPARGDMVAPGGSALGGWLAMRS